MIQLLAINFSPCSTSGYSSFRVNPRPLALNPTVTSEVLSPQSQGLTVTLEGHLHWRTPQSSVFLPRESLSLKDSHFTISYAMSCLTSWVRKGIHIGRIGARWNKLPLTGTQAPPFSTKKKILLSPQFLLGRCAGGNGWLGRLSLTELGVGGRSCIGSQAVARPNTPPRCCYGRIWAALALRQAYPTYGRADARLGYKSALRFFRHSET